MERLGRLERIAAAALGERARFLRCDVTAEAEVIASMAAAAAAMGSINLLVSDEELAKRRAEQDAKGWKPVLPRPRKVSAALKAYALLATSADKGAVRDLSLLGD